MRTMAQFGIRDADSALSDITETMENRTTTGLVSLRNGSVMASSLRNVEPAPQIVEQEEADVERAIRESLSLPEGYVEMPAVSYEDSIQETPEESPEIEDEGTVASDNTPTNRFASDFELPAINLTTGDGSLIEPGMSSPLYLPSLAAPEVPPPRVGPKPNLAASPSSPGELPTVDGRPGSDIYSTLPSQRSSATGGLRIHNPEDSDPDEWPQEAIMHMNLAGSRGHSRHTSREYNGM